MKISTIKKVIQNYLLQKKRCDVYKEEPIKKNKILFCSYRGRSYSCNPKYITEEILRQPNYAGFEVVWAFTKPEKYKWLEQHGIRVIEYYSEDFFRELMTAKFVVANMRLGIDFHKRPGQIYLQTWHGTLPLKTVEADAKKSLSLHYIMNAKSDSTKTDYIISGCKKRSEIIRQAFWYRGEILEIGNPRNDLFFESGKWKEIVSQKYHIEGKGIILYAPTFRKSKDLSVYNVDFERVLRVAEARFHQEYVVLCRLHPNLKGQKIVSTDQPNLIDVTDYDDMQELLSAADILITDFSSSMFDFAIMKKTCFLYASDYEAYVEKERDLYFDIENELPFPLAKNNEDLEQQIASFDEEVYQVKLEQLCKKIGLVEKGTAAKEVVKLFLSKRDAI